MSLLIVKAVRDVLTAATSVANLLYRLIGGSPTTGQALIFNGTNWASSDLPSGAARTLLTKTTNYTVLAADVEKRIMSSGASNITFTLPDPSAVSDGVFVFKRGDTGECLLQRYGSETIDGVSASYDLAVQESIALISNGTNWFSVAA